jgi:CheY-like chemotaxis protein
LFAGRKLLVADDSPYYQTVLGLTFTDEGMAVTTADDGQDALAKLEQSTPDVVLASVSMPGIGGYELCARIKQSERFGHIPVMLLVGLHEAFEPAEARRVGADDVVTKPFQSIRQLVSRVGSLLGGKAADNKTGGYSTLGLDRSDALQSDAPAQPIMDDTNVKVFVEAASMVEDEAVDPAVEAEGRACEADIERQTADTQRLEMPDAVQTAAPHDDVMADTNAKVFIEAPSMTEHEPAEPAVEAAGSTCAADLELQTANTQELERIDDEPHGETIKPIAYAQDDTMKLVPAIAPGKKSDFPANEFLRSVGTTEMNEEPSPRKPVYNDALLDLGDFDSPAQVLVADDILLDLDYEEPASASEFAAAELVPESTPVTEAFSPAEGLAPEAAPPTSEPTHEEQHVAELQEWDFVAETPSEPVPVSTVEGQESIDPELAWSPEIIDAIARRAVEHLSEKVVREIAWEVVPELAELLIKKKLEEQK